jgi:hypothetical protein
MKHILLPALSAFSLATAAIADPTSKAIPSLPSPSSSFDSAATIDKAEYQITFGRLTVGDKEVATAIEWNVKTGEARMLNAASFSDKSTGQQGNLIGWIPLVNLQQAVQNLTSQIQKQQTDTSGTNAPATPPKTQ